LAYPCARASNAMTPLGRPNKPGSAGGLGHAGSQQRVHQSTGCSAAVAAACAGRVGGCRMRRPCSLPACVAGAGHPCARAAASVRRALQQLRR
jgi:hypothetical protein